MQECDAVGSTEDEEFQERAAADAGAPSCRRVRLFLARHWAAPAYHLPRRHHQVRAHSSSLIVSTQYYFYLHTFASTSVGKVFFHVYSPVWVVNNQSWQVSPLMGNNQGYYRVITLWGEILSAIDKWQKLGRNSFTSFIALQSSSILPCVWMLSTKLSRRLCFTSLAYN